MRAELQAVHDGSRAVVVQARGLVGANRHVVVGILIGVDRPTFQKAHGLVEDSGIAGGIHVAAHCQGQPEIIVRTVGANAATLGRMPPVLHVAFAELAGRAEQ